jgi:outer membrane protein
MKKVVTVLVVVMFFLTFSTLFAQTKTEKGKIELGGSAAFSSNSFSFDGTHTGTITTFTLSPRIGYFVVNKLEIEPQLLVLSISATPEGGETNTASNFGGLLSLSYNFEGGSNLVPFVFAGIGFLSNSVTHATNLKTSMILPDAGVGLKAFVTDKGVLRAEAFYERTTNSGGEEKLTDNSFGLRIGFSVFLK